MSLHRGHDDVKELTTSYALSSADVQNATTIELWEYSSYDNSLRSSSAATATNLKRSTSQEKLHVKLWARVTNSFVDWWMGELLAILLSIIALLTIIIILYKYDDHALPRLPYNVPLNFVVSTLATVSKSSLLLAVASALGQFKWLWMSSKQRRLQDLQIFDEASRGPLGAAKLLASKRALSWASIGACVTILCLIFDPFIQGLITVSERVVYKDDPAALLHRIEDYPHVSSSYGEYLTSNSSLMNTINDAIFNPSSLPETQPRCPTGNCTWPLFASLGVCSKCQDISQHLQNSSTYVDTQMESIEVDIINGTYNESCTAMWRNYTYRFPKVNGQIPITNLYPGENLPWYDSLPVLKDGTFSISSLISKVCPTHDSYLPRIPAFFVFPLDWNSTTAVNFADGTSVLTVALTALIQTSTQDPDPGSVISADLCAFSLCAQQRNVSLSLNQLSSHILQTVYGTQVDHIYPSSGEYIPYQLSFLGHNLSMTYPSQVYELTRLETPLSNWESSLTSLISSLAGNLTGYLNDATIYPEATSSIMTAFNASSNISSTMDNIAITLTNYMRDSSNLTVAGQAGQTESYVHVTWLWITLPVFLVIAGTIFFVLAMFETKRLGAHIWKTSELALLFHGLEDSDQELNAINRSSGMEHVASGTKTKMAKTSAGGWMLRQEGTSIKSA